MRLLRNPITQFLAVGFLTILAVLVVTSRLAASAAAQEALAEAQRLNAVLARSVAGPGIGRELVAGDTAAIDRFDRQIKARLLVGDVDRVTIWDADGRILYSNAFRLIGVTFPLDAAHRAVLAEGGTGHQLSDPQAPVNRAARAATDLGLPVQQVRIFTRISGASAGEPLLFEGYYTFSDIESRRQHIYRSFLWITVGGPVLLLLLVTPMLWGLTRRLTVSAHDRARLLRSALDASDAERRRIARDLHDGAVQDLSGTAYSVAALARESQLTHRQRSRLNSVAGSLRETLTSLRSLQSEIYPPDLQVHGLLAALEDLVAPAEAVGITASVSVAGVEDVDDERVALVWRVAREAVRNALHHAEASTITVTVRADSRRLVLEVLDDGVGFDPAAARDSQAFGLRGLDSLVRDAGGVLAVRSSAGEGTTVRMEVAVS